MARAFAFAWIAGWASLASAAMGDGFQVGSGRLKLGAELSGRYDSMAAAGLVGASAGTVTSPGDGIGLARGTFQLDVPTDGLKLSLSGGLDLNRYMSLMANLSAFSFVGANINGSANYTKGAWGVDVTEALTRSDRTNNPLFAVGVLGLSNLTRARAWSKPGGGAIEFGGYSELGFDVYSPQVAMDDQTVIPNCAATDTSCNPKLANAFNSVLVRLGVDAKWRLLPKTGLTLEANYGYRSYLGSSSLGEGAPSNAQPIRVMAGFGSLLSTRYSFSLKGGYGGLLFPNAIASANQFVGQAEIGVRVTDTLTTRAGFMRTNEPVAGAVGYYVDNRVFAEAKGQFNRWVLSGLASLDFVAFGADAARQDTNVNLSVMGDYNILEWLRATGRFGASHRSSTNSAAVSAFGNFNRWELGAGVAALF